MTFFEWYQAIREKTGACPLFPAVHHENLVVLQLWDKGAEDWAEHWITGTFGD